MRTVDIIEKKVQGLENTREEIEFLINGLLSGEVEDYQMSAWMMAVRFKGMTDRETADLTAAMAFSGDTVDLGDIPGFKVDKHSTGGVGDTTTLIVAPLVAACGGVVAKMSGRGLAHTGGTIDKLESVPGVDIEKSIDTFKAIVKRIGVCVIGQSADLNPADKRMYALRDVTATVRSIPLIASSIMSKKIASGADGIVLDVKTGNGAFMQTLGDARILARTMVAIGKHSGRKTVALITDMNRPLGMAIGNALELKEAIAALSGKVPLEDPLMQVSLALAENMLIIAGIAKDTEAASDMLLKAVKSGEGLKKLRQMIEALGGNTDYIDDPELLVSTEATITVPALKSGYIGMMDSKTLGLGAMLLGAGREVASDVIDPSVGILMHKRFGERIEKGEAIAELFVNDRSNEREVISLIEQAVCILDEKPEDIPLIYDIVSEDNVN